MCALVSMVSSTRESRLCTVAMIVGWELLLKGLVNDFLYVKAVLITFPLQEWAEARVKFSVSCLLLLLSFNQSKLVLQIFTYYDFVSNIFLFFLRLIYL